MKRFGDHAAKTSGECIDTFAVFTQQFLVDSRVVIETFHKPHGGEIGEVLVAFVVFGNEHHVGAITLGLVHAVAGGNIGFAAKDRLYVLFIRSFIEVYGAVHITVVGNGDRSHTALLDGWCEVFHTDGPIEKRVLRMQVEVCKTFVFTECRVCAHCAALNLIMTNFN